MHFMRYERPHFTTGELPEEEAGDTPEEDWARGGWGVLGLARGLARLLGLVRGGEQGGYALLVRGGSNSKCD
jgi:hypothetical protein